MVTYKLYYFDARGRAEPIRVLLAQADVKYEDIRYAREDWMSKYKNEMPFRILPVLEVDGTKLCGSINILRYLGAKFGMAGKDELSDAILGGSSDYISDLRTKLRDTHYAEGDEKTKMEAEFKEKTVPNMFGVIQKNLKDGHFIGSDGKLSWVDIQGYTVFDVIVTNYGINLADYPEIKKLVDTVGSEPNIKKWVETRPKLMTVGI